MEGNSIGPNESHKEGRDGTLGEPLSERVEQELGTSVGILLPSIKLDMSDGLVSSGSNIPRHRQ
jgi:hypothetical protein